MRNNKHRKHVALAILSTSLSAVLLTGLGISAVENANPQSESTGTDTISPKEKGPRGKKGEAPAVFVPTEKVSADQAIAFPTDI